MVSGEYPDEDLGCRPSQAITCVVRLNAEQDEATEEERIAFAR